MPLCASCCSDGGLSGNADLYHPNHSMIRYKEEEKWNKLTMMEVCEEKKKMHTLFFCGMECDRA